MRATDCVPLQHAHLGGTAREGVRALGGVPKVLVLDNLKEGVLKPDIYDPTINLVYRDVLAHYQAIALPCRINDPDRKGKVESSVGHAQKTPLKGQRFQSLEEAQAYLDRWETNWASVLNGKHPMNTAKGSAKTAA